MGRIDFYLDKDSERKLKELMQKHGFKTIGETIRYVIDKTYTNIVEGGDIETIIEKLKQEFSKKFENLSNEQWKMLGKILRVEEKLKMEIKALENEEKELRERIAEQELELEKLQLMQELNKVINLTKDYFDTFKEDLAKEILEKLQKINQKLEEIEIVEKMKLKKALKKREKYYTQ